MFFHPINILMMNNCANRSRDRFVIFLVMFVGDAEEDNLHSNVKSILGAVLI